MSFEVFVSAGFIHSSFVAPEQVQANAVCNYRKIYFFCHFSQLLGFGFFLFSPNTVTQNLV